MRRFLLIVAAVLGLVWCAGPALAEKIVGAVSNTNIQISSSFSGETLTIFGNVEPEAGSQNKFVEGPFNVIIVIEGPLIDRVARHKTNQFGVWLNSEQVLFKHFPSFFHVLSSGDLRGITDEATLTVEGILPEAVALKSAETDWWDAAIFSRELVRLMSERGLFGINPQGVNFLSQTVYQAQLALPHDVPNGPFLARTYLFKNGELIAKRTDGFSVRKVGLERFLGIASQQYPLLYGLAAVILALFTGWLGGVVFKR